MSERYTSANQYEKGWSRLDIHTPHLLLNACIAKKR